MAVFCEDATVEINMTNERLAIIYRRVNTSSTRRFPLMGTPNQNRANKRIRHPAMRDTKMYGMVFPIIISGDFRGEMKSRSMEPDSFSREMLREVSKADIMTRRVAIRPGMKKKALLSSGLNRTLV